MIVTVEELKKSQGRILGVDFGDVRTGLAVSDAARFLASGLGTIAPGGLDKTAGAVADAVTEHQAVAVVVGLPVNMNGSHGERAEHVRFFAGLLENKLSDTPICLVDERMTTMAASRFLNETNTRGRKRKQVIDTLSAQIILQNVLDRLKYMSS